MAGNKYLTPNGGRHDEARASQSSAGAGDAGKIIALNSSGVVDPTAMPYVKGEATLAAGTATVTNAAATTTSHIQLTLMDPSTDIGVLSVTRATGSFVINSTAAADTSKVAWVILP